MCQKTDGDSGINQCCTVLMLYAISQNIPGVTGEIWGRFVTEAET